MKINSINDIISPLDIRSAVALRPSKISKGYYKHPLCIETFDGIHIELIKKIRHTTFHQINPIITVQVLSQIDTTVFNLTRLYEN